MSTADEVAAIANGIEGWLSERQGRALFAAAANTRGRGAVVEIGSWKGRSTVWLGCGVRARGGKVYAIDPHRKSNEDPRAETFEAFMANMDRVGLADVIEPVVTTSAQAAGIITGEVELLFVDGDHTLAGARQDAEIWLPRLMVGATVMFHDVATSGYSGPRRVFQRRICRSPGFHRIRRVGSMAIAERTAARSRLETLRARSFDLRLYFYDVEGAIKRTLRRVRRLRAHRAVVSWVP